MKRPHPIEVTLPHRHAERSEWRPGSPDPDIPECPGCGAPLRMDTAGPDDPDRLVATCEAPRCGEVVTFRRLEGRLIVAELRRR
jgi:hypothetical protein